MGEGLRESSRLPDCCVAEQRGLWHCHRRLHGFCCCSCHVTTAQGGGGDRAGGGGGGVNRGGQSHLNAITFYFDTTLAIHERTWILWNTH